MRIWRSLLTLVIIWVIAAGAFVFVQRFRATPEKFISYVAEHPLRGMSPAEREAIIVEAARRLNGLNTKQRREVKKSGALRTFFTELTQDERRQFARLTLPKGFRQMIVTLNEMGSAERKKVVQRTLRDLQNVEVSSVGDPSDIETMFTEGSSIFYKEASPQVIEDFAPVIEAVTRKRKIDADERR